MRSSMTKLRSTKKFEIVLDSNKLKWFYMSCAAALPQLDRGSDYESERHRFESYTPHQLKSKASGNGGFSFRQTLHGFEPRSRHWQLIYRFVKLFSNCRLTHRGLACIIIRALRRYLSWIEGLTTNQNVIGSNPIRRTN